MPLSRCRRAVPASPPWVGGIASERAAASARASTSVLLLGRARDSCVRGLTPPPSASEYLWDQTGRMALSAACADVRATRLLAAGAEHSGFRDWRCRRSERAGSVSDVLPQFLRGLGPS